MHLLLVSLGAQRLLIADLADRLEAMESGRAPMDPVAYLLYARHLADAVADYPPHLLEAHLGDIFPSVLHAIEQRRFESHGVLHGRAGRRAYTAAASVLRRLGVRAG